MAELILTDEEKAAALWSDLDDAALGKLVKKKIALLTDAAAQLDRVTTFAAAMLLCLAAAEQNANEIALEIDGLTQGGREFGDWKLVAMKTAGAPVGVAALDDELDAAALDEAADAFLSEWEEYFAEDPRGPIADNIKTLLAPAIRSYLHTTNAACVV